MELTSDKLVKILSENKHAVEWLPALLETLPKFDITTNARIAAFIAQCAHESNDFTVLKENLNYSADGLNKVFKKYFPTVAAATPYHRQPEKIANKVYANRMGNGDEASGDGFKYRGRGLIQLTGKNNYATCSREVYGDDRLVTSPELLETTEGALASACWYWTTNKLNTWADKNDFDGVCDVVNRGRKTIEVGDAIGFADRKEKYEKILKILEG